MTVRLTLSAAAAALLALPATSQVLDPNVDPVRVDVLSGWDLPDGRRMAAIRLTLQDGWKTYWRVPGDAGIPPRFNWQDARNISDLHITWPTPDVFVDYGMRSLGYKNAVVLPIAITPQQAGAPIELAGEMFLGICAEVCVPHQLSIQAELAPPAASPTPEIVAAMASAPYTSREAGVEAARCVLRPSEDGMHIEAHVDMPSAGGTEVAVIEPGVRGVWVSEPKAQRAGGTVVAVSEMIHQDGGPFSVDRSNVRITIIGANYAVDIQGCTG